MKPIKGLVNSIVNGPGGKCEGLLGWLGRIWSRECLC
jgi:hypothetical protein